MGSVMTDCVVTQTRSRAMTWAIVMWVRNVGGGTRAQRRTDNATDSPLTPRSVPLRSVFAHPIEIMRLCTPTDKSQWAPLHLVLDTPSLSYLHLTQIPSPTLVTTILSLPTTSISVSSSETDERL